MKGSGQVCRFLLLLLISVSGREHCTARVTPESRAVSVLYEQFETISYAESDLVLSSGAYDGISKNDADVLRLPFYEMKEALESLRSRTSEEILASSQAVLVGAKDFRPPLGLGPVRSRRCYILILRNGKFDLHDYFRQSSSGSIAGATIWNWSAKVGDFGEESPNKLSSFYVAQIASSYLLISNNLHDLQSSAKGLMAPDPPKMKSTGIGDWGDVIQHRIWCYRRYRHSGVVDQEAAGMSAVSRAAEALVFFVDSQQKTGLLRLISSNTNDDPSVKMNALSKLPPLKPQGSGVWETRIALSGDESSFNRLAVVMNFFGFGVYV